jgi:hypothetical protein
MRVVAAAIFASAIVLSASAFADETPAAAPVEQTTEAPAAAPAPEAGASGQSAPEQANVEQQEASAEGDANRVICRTVRRSESRLRSRSERICGTRDQWEVMQDDAARNTRRAGSIQSRSGS